MGITVKASTWVYLALGLVALVAGTAAVGWVMQTHEDEGTVVSLRWEQATVVQHWTDVVLREWRFKTWEKPEVQPVEGSGEVAGKELIFGTCNRELYNTSRQCTGTGEQQRCRTDREYRDRCNYRTQLWRTIRTVPAQGSGHETTWPVVELGPLDRQRFNARYRVTVQYQEQGEEQVYELNPAPETVVLFYGTLRELDAGEALVAETAYRSWSLHEKVTLDVNKVGSVRGIRHGGILIEMER